MAAYFGSFAANRGMSAAACLPALDARIVDTALLLAVSLCVLVRVLLPCAA